jgi:hypothetical protein
MVDKFQPWEATDKFGFGLDGYTFLDLGPDHIFHKEIGKVSNYVPFEKIMSLKLDDTWKSCWDNSPPRVFATYKVFSDFEVLTAIPRKFCCLF